MNAISQNVSLAYCGVCIMGKFLLRPNRFCRLGADLYALAEECENLGLVRFFCAAVTGAFILCLVMPKDERTVFNSKVSLRQENCNELNSLHAFLAGLEKNLGF